MFDAILNFQSHILKERDETFWKWKLMKEMKLSATWMLTVRSKLPHHVATRSKGHQCTGLSRSLWKSPSAVPRSQRSQRSQAWLPCETNKNWGRRNRGTVALSTGTFCLQYVLHVYIIYFTVVCHMFPLDSNKLLLSDSDHNCKVRQIEDRTHSRRWRLSRRRAWPAFDFAAVDHWEFGTSFTRWEHFELSTRACLRFARSVDPMVLDPTSDNGCPTMETSSVSIWGANGANGCVSCNCNIWV